jgi:hypothetical protein
MHVRDGHASALIADDRGGNARRYRFGVAQKPLILPHLRQGEANARMVLEILWPRWRAVRRDVCGRCAGDRLESGKAPGDKRAALPSDRARIHGTRRELLTVLHARLCASA